MSSSGNQQEQHQSKIAFLIRATSDQIEEIDRRAAVCAMSRNAYVVHCSLSGNLAQVRRRALPAEGEDREVILRALFELFGLRRDVRALVRQSTGLTAEVRAVLDQLDGLVEEIRNRL